MKKLKLREQLVIVFIAAMGVAMLFSALPAIIFFGPERFYGELNGERLILALLFTVILSQKGLTLTVSAAY